MPAKIIDGKKIAQQIQEEIRQRIEELKITPGLAVIMIGENPASQVYVNMKERACQKVGIYSFTKKFPSTVPQERVLEEIDDLNADSRIHGILIQLPLPEGFEESEIINAVSPQKDVDGFHPLNIGKAALGEDTFIPCTPAGIRELLLKSGYNPEGRHVVIVGRSKIVGRPLANLLLQKAEGCNATVTVCHTRTREIHRFTRQAEILVVAAGCPNFITGDMVRPGAVVIDVGVNRVEDPTSPKGYRIVGDVHFPSVSQVAEALSPVPGGVGPMTIAMLLKNTVKAAEAATNV